MKFQRLVGGVAAVGVLACAGHAAADTIVSNGGHFVAGVSANGEVFDGIVGLVRTSDGFDPISPGAPRDSWGLSAGGASAFGDSGSSFGLLSSSLVSDGTTATFTATTDFGFDVSQTYSFVGDILKIDTVVTNNTGDAQAAIFQRGVDWDLSENFIDNFLGGFGDATGVLESSTFGFEAADPAVPYIVNCHLGCADIYDGGSAIKINLGTIGAGRHRSFSYYYGVNVPGVSMSDLIAQAQGAGAAYVMAGQSLDSVNSAVLGVSGGVPEPAAWALMIAGFGTAGAALRRRRAALA